MADAKRPIGRSRGRGRGAFKRQPEPKPGIVQTSTVGDTQAQGNTIDELSQLVNALPLHPADKDMSDVVEMATRIPWTKDNLDEIFQVFYRRCSKHWQFSEYAAEMCNVLDSVNTESEKLRARMLIGLKQDNDGAAELREASEGRFLALVTLLCQMFLKFRINSEPLQILPLPITNLLKMSLDDSASEKELECAGTQLLAIGGLLQPFVDTSQWNEIRSAVKAAIVADRGSDETRLMLIQVIEGITSKWTLY